MSIQTEKLKKIKKKHEKHWLSIENVIAVGIGLTAKGQVGLIVSVTERTEFMYKKIPSRVDDIPVEIHVSGEIRAY
jgi:hypothetical protein